MTRKTSKSTKMQNAALKAWKTRRANLKKKLGNKRVTADSSKTIEKFTITLDDGSKTTVSGNVATIKRGRTIIYKSDGTNYYTK